MNAGEETKKTKGPKQRKQRAMHDGAWLIYSANLPNLPVGTTIRIDHFIPVAKFLMWNFYACLLDNIHALE